MEQSYIKNVNAATMLPYRTEILLFMGPKIWSLFLSNIHNAEMIEIFKQKISYWKLNNIPCRLFKTYIKSLINL